MRNITLVLLLTVLLSGGCLIGSTATQNDYSKTNKTTANESKASVGGGILILLSLGIGYSVRKLHDIRSFSRGLQD